MEYRKLGDSDITVPAICLGTMNWGQQNTEAEAHAQLDYAVEEKGLTFIDTAEAYPIPPEKEKQGRTESYIGSWLNKRGKRDDLIIASKVSCRIQKDAIGTRIATGLSRGDIRDAVEGSLTRLGTDYLDLYQVHAPDRPANYWGVRGVTALPENDGASLEETYGALAELVKEGKIRTIGVSNETPWGVMEYLRLSKEKGWPRIVSIQNQYSLINRTYEIGLSEMSLRENIGLLAYSPLSFGALTGKYLDGNYPPGARFTLWERNRDRYLRKISEPAVKRYVELAQSLDVTPAQLAIAFAAFRSFTTSTIIGATSLDQLKEDIAAGDIILSHDALEAIDMIYFKFPDPTW